MAKIPRKLLKVFGLSGAATNFARFGSQKAGTPVKTQDIVDIQSLSAWDNGIQDAINAGNKAPFLEDVNSLFYVLSYQQAYMLQEGVAEYDSATTYHQYSVVKKTGTYELYGSIVNDNVGNALPARVADTKWQYLGSIEQMAAIKNKNIIINGGMQVCQRTSAYTLVKDTYGRAVDMYAGMATGTAVSAGTLAQDLASSIGRTGAAIKFGGVTLTGAGALYLRYRMEAADAAKLKNRTASFQIRTIHDVGGAVNYTVYVRKANTSDNFAAVTAIADSGTISVAPATDTVVKFENISMGDCSSGLEIEIKVDAGAITTKNFSFTEMQIEEGALATQFNHKNIAIDVAACHRYFQVGTQYTASGSGGGGASVVGISLIGSMRIGPTVLSATCHYYSGGYWIETSMTSSSFNASAGYVTVPGGASGYSVRTYYSLSAEL